MVLNLFAIRPAQRNDPCQSAARCKDQDRKPVVDHAEGAIPRLAVVLAIIHPDGGGIEFEARDKCEINAMLGQIERAFSRPRRIRRMSSFI
jgi:hypothetical protein